MSNVLIASAAPAVTASAAPVGAAPAVTAPADLPTTAAGLAALINAAVAAALAAAAPVPTDYLRSPTAGAGPAPRLYNINAVITAVVANPKVGKAAARYAAYKVGASLADAIKGGVTAADIRWDLARGFIKLAA